MREPHDPDAVTYVEGLLDRLEPFDNRPRAQKVLVTDSAHVVLFAFDTGHALKEHAAHHSVLIQAISGHLRFSYDDTQVDLRPGDLIHLPPGRRHAVVALEPSRLTVTMLVTDGA